ncbi:hypothetical protein ACJBQ9_11925, partial [Streptococcus suis]
LYPDALIYDKQRGHWFYIAQPNIDRRALYLDPLATQAPVYLEFEITRDWSSNMSLAQYSDKFARIQAYLKSGDCYQINLA